MSNHAQTEDDAVWTGSKAQKDALRAKFGGRCAYCGGVLDKMHADHMVPILRIHTDGYGNRLPPEAQRLHRPERNVVSNMMPACGPCNLHKSGYSLEEWRALLSRAPDVLSRDKSIYRAAVRFGLIAETREPVVFHFERALREVIEEGEE